MIPTVKELVVESRDPKGTVANSDSYTDCVLKDLSLKAGLPLKTSS
jgi:hypothetical protein